MDYNEALAWLAYATKKDGASIIALQLTDRQTIALGSALKENKLLNPPRERKQKRHTFICACPCRKAHVGTYKTKKPIYINAAHKVRAFREKGIEAKRIGGRPMVCTSCMVRIVINPESLVREERYMCHRCFYGLKMDVTPSD